MVSQGHKVTIVCPKPIARGTVEPMKGLTIINVPSLPFTFYNLNAVTIFPLALPILEKLIRGVKFDVAHIQEAGVLGIAALIKVKKYHIPVIGALHFIPEQIDRVLWGKFENVLTPVINVYVKLIYNKYDEAMAPSNFFANYLKRVGVIRPINVISNGTDIRIFHPAGLNKTLRKRLGFSDQDFVFFFLGRIDKDKNVETLVRAMPFTDPEVKLLIVGKGTQDKFLHSLSKKLKVQNKIVWIDYITDSEMADFYHAVDAFSIMSPYEGQSIVTLQAVASGLPVIAARAGALPELCRNNENGFLVDTYDFRTLSERMNRLARHKELREKFGRESRKISLAHNKVDVLHKLELIFDKLGKHTSRAHQGNISQK
jgi:glycosyltransferase involved in cell wall biosynthesis